MICQFFPLLCRGNSERAGRHTPHRDLGLNPATIQTLAIFQASALEKGTAAQAVGHPPREPLHRARLLVSSTSTPVTSVASSRSATSAATAAKTTRATIPTAFFYLHVRLLYLLRRGTLTLRWRPLFSSSLVTPIWGDAPARAPPLRRVGGLIRSLREFDGMRCGIMN